MTVCDPALVKRPKAYMVSRLSYLCHNASDRDGLQKYLKTKAHSIHYPLPPHKQEAYKEGII